MTGAFEANFAKRFPGGPRVEAKLSLPTDRFSATVLFGPSGAGKTTVLRCIAGLERPDSGTIALDDATWFDGLSGVCQPPQQRDIGFLAQDYALFPHLRVIDNIGYGLTGLARQERNQRVGGLLEMLGLSGLESRYPRQISGGEQQRVALARAMAKRPKLLFLDEPLSAIDAPTRGHLRGELRRWLVEMGVPSLIVTHDLTEALSLGDSLAVMNQGRMCQTGRPEEVVTRPASLEVARVVGMDNIQAGTVQGIVDGRTSVNVQGTSVIARGTLTGANHVYVCIGAGDVRLTLPAELLSPIDNQLPGVVKGIVRDSQYLRVTVDCGFPLIAIVPMHDVSRLTLALGKPVVAQIAVDAIHLIDAEAGND